MKPNEQWDETPDGYLKKTPIFQFALITMLFALWSVASSLNDILITQFKTVFHLSDFATAFVQSAFYGGYFVIAIPAALFIKKTSYKMGIIAGLSFFALGCFMFFPASHVATYGVFLVAIFIEAIGLSFLETSSDTYATLLGPKRLGTLRINIAQTMNALGGIVGIFLGKYLVFQETNLKAEMEKLTGEAATRYGQEQLARTLGPYKYLLIILLVLIVVFIFTKFPSGRPKTTTGEVASATMGETLRYLVKNRRFQRGVLAQFLYIGVQIGIWSFTIRLALEMFPHFSDRYAANFMLYSYVCFFVGRTVGSYLLTRFRETRLLTAFICVGVVLLLGTAFIHSIVAIWLAVAVSFFMGPAWPTIYSRTLETVEDRRYTETAGAFVVMAIVGGAVLPALQGLLSDATSMQFSFLLPAIEFALVAVYFLSEMKHDKLTPAQLKAIEETKGAAAAEAAEDADTFGD
ncbi:L-fucose:H+ symporter permease [Bifidobacterium aemilianum]|uniref:L-fucose:H+ symporter permease n=1 Tax=Bifidobacterium aemilianum TaxID=2493120 RepID=A0A366K838_9BIFI|nr:L-fucose:H+ symporter permease [Bifidobacterium aemilianum]RBP97328.1 L-fucose:H+ symporter permease [Bifidobacterium aemilianum]